jgi:hypothetical protein
MLITRREDGLYTSGIVYTTVGNKTLCVSTEPYVGATHASVIAQAVGNALVRQWRSGLVQKWSVKQTT